VKTPPLIPASLLTGDVSCTEQLITARVNLEHIQRSDGATRGMTPLLVAVSTWRRASLCEGLNECEGPNEDLPQRELTNRAAEDALLMTRLLLEAGVDTEPTHKGGNTSLLLAISSPLLRRASTPSLGTIVNGHFPCTENNWYKEPPHIDLSMACLLVEYGADVTAVGEDGSTALEMLRRCFEDPRAQAADRARLLCLLQVPSHEQGPESGQKLAALAAVSAPPAMEGHGEGERETDGKGRQGTEKDRDGGQLLHAVPDTQHEAQHDVDHDVQHDNEKDRIGFSKARLDL